MSLFFNISQRVKVTTISNRGGRDNTDILALADLIKFVCGQRTHLWSQNDSNIGFFASLKAQTSKNATVKPIKFHDSFLNKLTCNMCRRLTQAKLCEKIS